MLYFHRLSNKLSYKMPENTLGCSFGCTNQLNFAYHIMKFYNCHYPKGHSFSVTETILYIGAKLPWQKAKKYYFTFNSKSILTEHDLKVLSLKNLHHHQCMYKVVVQVESYFLVMFCQIQNSFNLCTWNLNFYPSISTNIILFA